jgi:hydrogenase maturation protease
MTAPRILIACIGNIFLGDDGFGTEVARQLAARNLPPEVMVKDFGIRGLDLTWALLDPYEMIVLVDTCRQGGQPGTVYLVEPDPAQSARDGDPAPFEPHEMNPMNVLRLVESMGCGANRIVIVGCEPATIEWNEEGTIGLSFPVQDAVERAIALIESIISQALAGEPAGTALQTQ